MSKHTSSYKVAAASCYVTLPGVGSVLLYRDAPVPDGVENDLDQLVADGFLVVVDEGEAGGHPSDLPPDYELPATAEPATDEADDGQADDVDGDGPIPPKSATKDVWVAYAVSQRPEGTDEAAAQAEAEALTKEQLIETYGRPAS